MSIVCTSPKRASCFVCALRQSVHINRPLYRSVEGFVFVSVCVCIQLATHNTSETHSSARKNAAVAATEHYRGGECVCVSEKVDHSAF